MPNIGTVTRPKVYAMPMPLFERFLEREREMGQATYAKWVARQSAKHIIFEINKHPYCADEIMDLMLNPKFLMDWFRIYGVAEALRKATYKLTLQTLLKARAN